MPAVGAEYWTDEDRINVKKSKNFKELVKIALIILKRMHQPVGQVCGPISSGGYDSIKKNLKLFYKTIKDLSKDRHIFNQVPFESPMQRIKKRMRKRQRYSHKRIGAQLLREFYLPVFKSGYVKTLFFMPNWKTSKGAKWEHQQARRLGIRIVYL